MLSSLIPYVAYLFFLAMIASGQTLPGMPPVIDARNVYSETTAGKFSPATSGVLSRVYVPNLKSGDLYVIDINNVGRSENKRKKRLLDLVVSGGMLLFLWLFIWFQKNKLNFISNCFNRIKI